MNDPLARFRLDGRLAIVTGVSSGMGVTFAETLAAAGARVVVPARCADELGGVAARIRGRRRRARARAPMGRGESSPCSQGRCSCWRPMPRAP